MLKVSFLFVFILIGCVFDQDDQKLLLRNSSAYTIYYALKIDSILVEKDIGYLQNVYYMKLAPGDSTFPLFARNGEGWERKINAISKDSTFRLFIFKVDSVKRYGWQGIIKLKRYTRMDLKVKYLDSLDWKISYRGFQN